MMELDSVARNIDFETQYSQSIYRVSVEVATTPDRYTARSGHDVSKYDRNYRRLYGINVVICINKRTVPMTTYGTIQRVSPTLLVHLCFARVFSVAKNFRH